MRVGLHVQYEEQKEEIELEAIPQEDLKKLEKIYWLVLRPLYRKLKKCEEEPEFFPSYFHKADLLKWALCDEVLDPQQPESMEKVKPIVAHLVEHLALKTISRADKPFLAHRDWHKPHYSYLSSILSAEPLREVYIDTLMRFKQHTEISDLIAYLANIPNRCGVRQALRLEKLELLEAILAMTTKDPEGENPVLVRSSGAPDGRYLRQAVVDQIIEHNGNLKRKYQGSAHEVAFASYQNFKLHFKQKSAHALMEYAIYALLGRFNAHLAPPIELARFEVQGQAYPVLISKTVDGRTLGENDRLESVSYTWGCLTAILTRPGDGRFSNCVKENQTDRLVLIDQEISFLEPVTCESKKHAIHFTSALFCLRPQALDRIVLKQFIDLDPNLILQSWMEELIGVDRLYRDLHLFSIEEETSLYKEAEKRFKGTLLLRSGVVTSLLVQFYHLQDRLRQALESQQPIYPLDLLPFLITLRDNEKQTLNYVHRSYLKASRLPTPKQRLAAAVNRDVNLSMTSLQTDGISFGKLPSMQEILAREEFAPEKAQEELFLCTLCQRMPGVTVGKSKGQPYIKVNFEKIQKKGQPDLDLQRLLLRALIFFMERANPKPTSIALVSCSVLDLNALKCFLHAGLKRLNLSYAPLLKQDAVEEIEKRCPNLKRLYLNGCRLLQFFQKTIYLLDLLPWPYLHFPKLEVLQLKSCPLLESFQIEAPCLKELLADHNPRLKTLRLYPFKLYVKGSFTDCGGLDLEKIKRSELLKWLKWLPGSKIPEHMVDPLLGLYDNDPALNLEHRFIGHEGAKALTKALMTSFGLTELNLENNRTIKDEEICRALDNHANLRALNLASNQMSSQAIYALIQVLNKQSSLTALNLAGNERIALQMANLGKTLRKHPLVDLNLEDCRINKGIDALHKFFKQNTSLQSVNLSGNQIDGDQAERLAKALAHNQSLTSIKLSRNAIQFNAALKALSDLFNSLPNLHTIDLADNEFSDGAFASLIEVLPSLPSLTSLNIDNNNLGKKGIKALTHIVASTPTLASLKGAGAVMGFSQTLATMSRLSAIDLSEALAISKIPLTGVILLKRSLLKSSSLREVNLERNRLGPQETMVLCKALESHPHLHSINFSTNNIGDAGAEAVTRLLAKLTSLQSLNLRGNNIGPLAMQSLCECLNAYNTLTLIDLSHNDLQLIEGLTLPKILENNPSLTSLSLELCGLIAPDTAQVINFLQRLSELTTLNLAGNIISQEQSEDLSGLFKSADKSFISLNLASTGLKTEGMRALGIALLYFLHPFR